jgi:hypothetical protein
MVIISILKSNYTESESGIMSKPIYAVKNGQDCLGILWETDKKDKIFVCNRNSIDINFDLEVRSFDTGEDVSCVDFRDLLMDALPHMGIEKDEEQ